MTDSTPWGEGRIHKSGARGGAITEMCHDMKISLNRSLLFPESIELLVVSITGTIIQIRNIMFFPGTYIWNTEY